MFRSKKDKKEASTKGEKEENKKAGPASPQTSSSSLSYNKDLNVQQLSVPSANSHRIRASSSPAATASWSLSDSSSLEPEPIPYFTNKATSLSALLDIECRVTNTPRTERPLVPVLVRKCSEYLFQKGLATEGLFRVPGDVKVMTPIEDEFNRGVGHLVDFKQRNIAVEDVASLLKKFLRNSLSCSLFIPSLAKQFSQLQHEESESERRSNFLKLFEQLPYENQDLTLEWLDLLVQVSANSDQNKMDPVNLATVFGEMAGVPFQSSQWCVQYMIEQYDSLFLESRKEKGDKPVFIRKFRESKSLIMLIPVTTFDSKDFVLCADSGGSISVWDPHSYKFIKRVTTDKRYYFPPLYIKQNDVHQLWIVFPDDVRIWDISMILDSKVSKIEDSDNSILKVANACSAVVVEEKVWVVTPKSIQIFDIRTRALVGEIGHPYIFAIGYVAGSVWTANKQKKVTVWNIDDLSMIKEVEVEELRQPKAIFEIEEKIWIVNSRGPICVLDPKSLCIISVLSDQIGAFHVTPVGNLCWSCAWDSSIVIWDPKKLILVKRLPNRHEDAISWISPLPKRGVDGELIGWDVWTCSSDCSIHVTFVPVNYVNLALDAQRAVEALTLHIQEQQDTILRLENDLQVFHQRIEEQGNALIEQQREIGADALLETLASFLLGEQQKEIQLFRDLEKEKLKCLQLQQNQTLHRFTQSILLLKPTTN